MHNRHKKTGEAGAILPFVVVLGFALISLIALVVDGMNGIAAKLQLQNATEYAALSALREFRRTGNDAIARAVADEIVAGNHLIAEKSGLRSVVATFGKLSSGAFNANQLPYNAVRIEAATTPNNGIRTLFARIWQVEELQVGARALAYIDSSSGSDLYGVTR